MTEIKKQAIAQCKEAIRYAECPCGCPATWGEATIIYDDNTHKPDAAYSGCSHDGNAHHWSGPAVDYAIYARARGHLKKSSSIAALLDP